MKAGIRILLCLLFPAFCFFCKKDPPVTKRLTVTTLVSGLEIPWGMAFLPNGDFLFTEKYGRISLLKKNESNSNVLMRRALNTFESEGGLLDIAVDPDFNKNHFIYIYETAAQNQIVRLIYENGVLREDKVIVSGIPQAVNHNGGALKFGPDGYLYVGTGDATVSANAQDKNSLSGKILRVDRDGNAAPGNPFGNKIWTYGHRNVQGFDWTPSGMMLATEHGPTTEFGWCCHDEINIIRPGKNYGWPLAIGGTESDSLTPPLINSGNDTWAPSGCFYVKNSNIGGWTGCLVVGALRGQRLIRFYIDDLGKLNGTSDTLQGQFGRIRNFIQAPDGSFLFSTSNYPVPEGDKILKIELK